MNLSIIIPSYNTKELLDRCLASIYVSLKGKTMDFEVIVVDNASDDGSRELLNKKYPRVKTILNKENAGYGRANNQGIRKATGDYVLLLNSDIVVQNGAIEKLLMFGKSQPNAYVGGKLLNEDGSPQASCGPMYSLAVVFMMLFCKGDSLGITRYSPSTTTKVDWISGACILAKRESFIDAGLFDEGIFLYMEEIDLLYRAKRDVVFYPDAEFVHTGAASSGSRRTPVINIYKGLLYFYKKHRSIMEQRILLAMLRLKANVAIALGSRNLRNTYEQALTVTHR
jgi:GT2 family glycosyltransferase